MTRARFGSGTRHPGRGAGAGVRRARVRVVLAPLSLLLATTLVAPVRNAAAQAGGTFDLSWSRIASGGANTSSGGAFSLAGTIGQADAGITSSSGGSFDLTGGFWTGVSMSQLADAPATPRVPAALSLRGFAQNPTVASRLQVSFSLATDESAQLELLDVAGRRVSAYAVGLLGPGPHTLDLGAGVTLSPGLYWIRLAQGGREQVRKAVVVR